MPQFTEKSFDFSYLFKNFFTKWYFYVIAVGLIIFVVLSLFLFKNKEDRNRLSKTQKIVYTAILSALCFVVNAFTIPISSLLQISLIATVGFVAGFLLGPGLGFTSAFIGDLICAITFPQGPYSPIINVGTALWGYIPGMLFCIGKGRERIKIVLSFALGFVLNSFCVNTVGIALMYNTPFDVLLVTLPIKLLVVVINCGLSFGLLELFKKVLPKDKFNV